MLNYQRVTSLWKITIELVVVPLKIVIFRSYVSHYRLLSAEFFGTYEFGDIDGCSLG